MSRASNFSAGPAALPEPVLAQARDELLEWRGERASVMEVSHRGQAFIDCAAEAERDLRELMSVPDDYHVLFLQGGATTLSALLPLNLAGPEASADYLLTGHWGEKAMENAAPSLRTRVVASGKAGGYRGIPVPADWELDASAAYLHYTPNETIHGVEFRFVPDAGEVPLVADFSSSLLSEPVDVSRFGVIYGGAQKNLGPAGLTLAIVRKDLLGRHGRALPPIFDLANQAKNDSMFNTPPTFAWYLVGLVLKWLKGQGGAAGIGARNAGSSEATGFDTVPEQAGLRLDPDAAYLHFTTNETIHGVEFHDIPEVGDVPLVADFSSSLLSRPVDVSRFGVIYGGAQKNLGPAGLAIAIVRKDLLGRHERDLPPIFELANQANNDSMFNTPPTLSWYIVGLVLKWLKAEGGAAVIGERNARKSALLYDAIDGSGGFYRNHVEVAARSRMNVPFVLPDAALDKPFLKEADAAGLLGLKGHRALGGMRASIYNAMPLAGVQALVDFMADFQRRNG